VHAAPSPYRNGMSAHSFETTYIQKSIKDIGY
jgi:hypothetical protein